MKEDNPIYIVAVYNPRMCMKVDNPIYIVAVYNPRMCMKEDNPILNFLYLLNLRIQDQGIFSQLSDSSSSIYIKPLRVKPFLLLLQP